MLDVILAMAHDIFVVVLPIIAAFLTVIAINAVLKLVDVVQLLVGKFIAKLVDKVSADK